jgi:hypothetical protein
MQTPPEALAILRRVGWVLIVMEALNLAWAAAEFLSGKSHSISLDLTVFVGAYFLVTGNLRAARWVAWGCAFLVAATVTLVLAVPSILPPDLLGLWFRLHRRDWLVGIAVAGATLLVAAWAFVQLRSKPVIEAERAEGRKPFPSWTGFAAGAAFALLLVGAIHAMFTTESGQKAIRLAREQKGPRYRYVLTSLRINNSEVSATVIAYDDSSVEDVEVSWSD